jgi:molybdate transport repressor ModE-like protein
MDKFAAMRVFVRIADAGNLSAAGRQLGLSLTSVSRQLMALEEVLGTTLVERTTRHLSLTESGRLYYERAKQILEEVAEMERGLTMQTGVASASPPVVHRNTPPRTMKPAPPAWDESALRRQAPTGESGPPGCRNTPAPSSV